MNGLEMLARQHDFLVRCLAQLEHAPDDQRLPRLLDLLRREGDAHGRLEQDLFYPALTAVPALRSWVQDVLQEHRHISARIDELSVLPPGSGGWVVSLARLREDIERHVRVEERDLFPWARRACTEPELERMGEQLAELRRWLGVGEQAIES